MSHPPTAIKDMVVRTAICVVVVLLAGMAAMAMLDGPLMLIIA